MPTSISSNVGLTLPGLLLFPSPYLRRHCPYLNSKKGFASRALIFASGIIFITVILGITWYLSGLKSPPRQEETAISNSGQTGNKISARIDSAPQETADISHQPGDEDLWQAIKNILQVERIHHSGDPKKKEGDLARKDFNHIKQLIKSLKAQGLSNDTLYDEAESRLVGTYGPQALKMLEGYRMLEEELAKVDLDAMDPAEQLEYLHKARQYAFGEEMADTLFYNQEAFARYHLIEKSILEDRSLSPAAQQEALAEHRKALQVDLAARGSYVSFADERKKELENKLQARYGESLQTMTDDERKSAIWEMYSEELPPEIMDRVGHILAVQAEKKRTQEAYRQERDAIMNDPDLTYEQKQEQLLSLKEKFNITP